MSFSFSLNPLKFEDVRNQIILYLQQNSDFAGQFDFTSSNIGLIVDTMAYTSMLFSYQLTNTTNNLFLDTTNYRKNAVSIAKTMGYRPKRAISSKIYGTIEYIDTNSVSGFSTTDMITIPAQSIFLSDKGFQYINLNPIILSVSNSNPYKLTSNQISLVEGTLKTFSYLGNSTPFQSFIIPSSKIEENNFKLSVRKNTNTIDSGILWDEVKDSFNLINRNSYFVEEDIVNAGYPKIVFGNGDVTNYPTLEEIIDIQYIETNANSANNCALTKLPDYNTFIISESLASKYNSKNFVNISTTTNKSYGGTSIETLEQIKINAPQSFCSVGRLVTKNDYNSFISRISYIYKSNAIGGDNLYPTDPNKFGNIYLSIVPLQTNIFDLYNNSTLYLNTTGDLSETTIANDIENYKIISTKLNFLKPSYVQLNMTPKIEINDNLTAIEIESIKKNILSNLNTYIKLNFNGYNTVFRSSKINSVITSTPNVISSDITCTYSFPLTQDSFYDVLNIDNSSVYLPIKIKTKDAVGNITAYENFVRTNWEQKLILNTTKLLPSQSTIYGKINHPYIERYIYNIDSNNTQLTETCNIVLDSKVNMFSFFKSSDTVSTIITSKTDDSSDNKGIIANVTPSAGTIDSYDLSITHNNLNYNLGKLIRTYSYSNGFKGLVQDSSQIISANNGNFYESISNFPISGISANFDSLQTGDYIIYNQAISAWQKVIPLGNISALTDADLYTNVVPNSIYNVYGTEPGTFDDMIATPVSGGDQIIFNNSTSSIYKWEKINNKNISFSATASLPKEVIPYELKRIVLYDNSSTTFDGRLVTNPLVDGDLIFYNISASSSDESIRWQKLGNVNNITSSGSYIDFTRPINAYSANICTLDSLNYNTESTTGVKIGDCYYVVGVGDFGLSNSNYSVKVNWNAEPIAYDYDIIVYIGIIDGSPTWNIWQPTIASQLADGTIKSDLPIEMKYADSFNVSDSGTFNSYFTFNLVKGDQIVYLGNNLWKQLIITEPISGLNPNSHLNLPTQPSIGECYIISKAGSFSTGNGQTSSLIAPSGDSFIEGDYIIFNGTHYTKMKEYTFKYNDITNDVNNLTARNVLNNILGLSSLFEYNYNNLTKNYEFYFNDIFNKQAIGQFRYINNDTSLQAINTIGRINFNAKIYGSYDGFIGTNPVETKTLFDSSINKINFLPRNKIDVQGMPTNQQETNFNTNFNTIVTFNINNPVVSV